MPNGVIATSKIGAGAPILWRGFLLTVVFKVSKIKSRSVIRLSDKADSYNQLNYELQRLTQPF